MKKYAEWSPALKRLRLPLLLALLGLSAAWVFTSARSGSTQSLADGVSNFAAVFLGIFIEAAPFLLLGTLASGLVEVFFDQQELARLMPRQPLLAVLTGALMGLFFPVCECGVVPLTRRLYQKGLPVGAGIAFLLAAPVLNPIVIASTYAAFGSSPVFWGRLGLTLLVAVSTGFIFSLQPDTAQLLRVAPPVLVQQNLSAPVDVVKPALGVRLRRMLVIAGDEFFEMGRYLVIGAGLAALMQTFLPQSLLLNVSQGPVISVLVMILTAVLLSVCSTVDAFIALAFSGVFSSGAVLAFLVYGPMVDIKSTLMFLRVFRRRNVLYLVLLPLLMTILLTVGWNYLLAG